ncbi:MAG: hypothetical protein AVDCRST_MAG35-634, partial [uncultured Quadrisphaera sp.]
DPGPREDQRGRAAVQPRRRGDRDDVHPPRGDGVPGGPRRAGPRARRRARRGGPRRRRPRGRGGRAVPRGRRRRGRPLGPDAGRLVVGRARGRHPGAAARRERRRGAPGRRPRRPPGRAVAGGAARPARAHRGDVSGGGRQAGPQRRAHRGAADDAV